MKICVRADGYHIGLWLPTGLIFNGGTAFLAEHLGRRYSGFAMDQIPPGAVIKLFAEFRRIKRKHGTWELVSVESSSGECIKIIL